MYQKYESVIKNLASDFFPNKEDAEDAIQEVTLKLVGLTPPDDNPDAWAYVVIRNAMSDELRKWKSRNKPVLMISDELVEENDPFEYAASCEAIALIHNNYDSLPEDIRITFELRYKDELSYDQIAEQLNVPIGTVGSRIARGKAMLS